MKDSPHPQHTRTQTLAHMGARSDVCSVVMHHHFPSTFLGHFLSSTAQLRSPCWLPFQVQAVGGTCCFSSGFLTPPGRTLRLTSERCVYGEWRG